MNQFDKLIKSVKKGDIQKVSQILQQATLNINELDPKSGKSLLQLSMETENDDIFALLIGYPGIDVQKPSREGESPLQTAIILNNYFYVEKLLSTHNINPKRKNINQQTPLQIAIKNQTSPQILKKLLHFKFDLNQSVHKHGNLVNLAIANNQVENLLFLLKYGTEKGDKKDTIKINFMDDQDNSCLALAVTMNLGDAVMAIFDYLSQENCVLGDLQKQFLINTQNKEGNTALHIACIKNLQTIMSLIETRGKQFGLDSSLRNKKSQTPDDIKTQTQKQRQLQKQLKEKNQQEKRIYLKEKEEEKQRRKEEEERLRVEEKRKKKEEELFLMKQQQYEKELTFNKTKWVCGILIVAMIAGMYLVLLNTIETKKTDQF